VRPHRKRAGRGLLTRLARFRHWRGTHVIAAVAVILGTTTLAAAPASAAPACAVDYKILNQWTGGFVAELTVTNKGDAWNGWRLSYAFPDAAQRLSNGWSATWAQSGQNVTADALDWNRNLATGASTTIGFQGTFGTANPKPTAFSVNGTACGGTGTAPTVAITSPADDSTFTAGQAIPIAATAADTDGTVTGVSFYAGNTLISSDTTAPYTANWTGAPVGSHVLVARATDNAGNTGASSPVDITVTASTGPSIVASPTAVNVPEGGTAAVSVHLSTQPAANVTVGIARSAGDVELSATPASMTFTPSNWSTNQSVTLRAAEDADRTNGTADFAFTATGHTAATVKATELDNDQTQYAQRFLDLYAKIKNPANGYFSSHNPPIPYHSVETLIVEAPDYGHVTTSEAFSYWILLEASYGRVTQDWTRFNEAWASMEKNIIPGAADQPGAATYNPADPATYAPEFDQPSQYPTPLDNGVAVGSDPLMNELKSAYGTSDIYGMHWLLDVDNRYGYGRCGDGTTSPAYINTFQRGPQESVWETVPHPSCETFTDGGTNGFLDLFTGDASYAKQWRYTNAPDADARAIQAAYWALEWAKEQGKESSISSTVGKAAKMGDYLRYSMYDKYFKKIGDCVGATTCPAGTGRDSSHQLLSWYYSWGGATDGSWAWRIGSSYNHFGYQNPLAAMALSTVPELKPKSGANAVNDWSASLKRQLEFYRWLQTSEGAIAGGATNSWAGRYGTPPAEVRTNTFYGMFFDWQPVYHDPPSSEWFGMQAWSMERVAEFYYATTDAALKAQAKTVLDKWVAWAMSKTTINADGTYAVPSTLTWTGVPDKWNAASPGTNANLHVNVTATTQDVGVTAAYAKTLTFYAAESGNTAAANMAKALLDGMWNNYSDPLGVALPEQRKDYNRFDDVWSSSSQQGLYIPSGWSGTMANGDPIGPGSTFESIRSWYHQDPQWSKVQNYLTTGQVPEFTYHRFWAQADIAVALAEYARLFPSS